MPVAGIDVSSRAVDVVLLDDDTDHAEWTRYDIHIKNGTAFDAARRVRDVLPQRFHWIDKGVWLIGLEDPFSRNQGTAKALGMVTGALLACLPSANVVPIVRTPPQEWKRVTTGKAKAAKEDVRLWAWWKLREAHGKRPTWPQDAMDAYCIAWAVRHLNQQAIDRTEGAAA